MKIVSFNVNGIRSILKKNFEEDFYLLDADIFSLNETKLSSSTFPFNPSGYFIYNTFSKERKGYSGVCVLSKKEPLNVHYGLINNKYDNEGRVVTLEFNNFFYVASYVPNASEELKRLPFRLEYEKDLIEYFKTLNKPIIYAGDLNVAHQEIDIKNVKPNIGKAGFTYEERDAFTHLLNEGYIDAFRYKYPSKIQYTWWSYMFHAREKNAGWRIDYFVVSNKIKDKINDCILHNEIMGSDHCPIELDIDL